MRSQMVMVLFNEGDFGIWDLDHNLRVSISSYLRGRDLKAVDCDWINESVPVVGIPKDPRISPQPPATELSEC